MKGAMPSFLRRKDKRKLSQERIDQVLKIDQRVVTFIWDYPARGTVRYIGEEKDSNGNVQKLLGLEMVSVNK